MVSPTRRSRFLFEGSLPERVRLPRSDYYRAQHAADRIWALVGPRYNALKRGGRDWVLRGQFYGTGV